MNRKKSGVKGDHHSLTPEEVRKILEETKSPRGRLALASLTTMHQDQLTQEDIIQIQALINQLR